MIDRTGRVSAADIARLRALIGRATAEVGVTGTLDVAVIDDNAMAAAHERYSGVLGTTDVLTFDHRSAVTGRREIETELLVCLDEATRRSAEHGHGHVEELCLYALHGVLHCIGYDDRTAEASAAMHTEEDRVLTAIGVGPVFDAAPRAAGSVGAAR